MQALVTGGGGFLGSAIVKQLIQRADRVRVLGRNRYAELEALGAEAVQADIRDADRVAGACRGVDVVYHVAGRAGLGGPCRLFYETNTLGTKNVLDGCRRHDVPRLVHTSSPSVAFGAGDQCGIDESHPYPDRWLAHYPHSKALAEQMVLRANGDGGLMTCAIRPHLIWGPGDRQLVPRLWERARRGRLRRVGPGDNLIDIVYVDNAAEAHLAAADRLTSPEEAPAGRAYFISQGEPVPCWEWIDRLLALKDLPPVQRSISFNAAWRLGAMLEAVWAMLRLRSDPPMTRFLAAQLAKSHYFDISAARRDLGYQPRVSTEEGMRRLEGWLAGGMLSD